MEPFELTWAAKVLNADVLGEAAGEVTGICIDSRKVTPGALFFALLGEHADGHEYVAKALAAGAAGAVVSRPVENVKGALLVVPDTLRALGDLAMHYRKKFTLPVVGVTGSVGKTSTKEMIAAVLRTKYQVLASEKNYNNEIGVPLTIFQLTKQHTAAVIEMGMRASGEIDRLAEIAQPTLGVVINIGYAHIELLGSRENIAIAKAELFARLPAGGTAIMPASGFGTKILKASLPEGCQRLTWKRGYGPNSTVRVPISSIRFDDGGRASFRVRVGKMTHSLPVSLQVPGEHHLDNSLPALAVAYALGVPIPQAIDALEAWTGAEGRMVVRHTSGGLTILDDCYNAGPESMRSALETLERMTPEGVAILGDMRELGNYTEEAHRQVGRYVGGMRLRLLVTVGEGAREIAAELRRTFAQKDQPMPDTQAFPDTERAAAAVRNLIKSGDTVLIKGSRAMEMEKIVAVLTGEESAGGHG